MSLVSHQRSNPTGARQSPTRFAAALCEGIEKARTENEAVAEAPAWNEADVVACATKKKKTDLTEKVGGTAGETRTNYVP